MRIQLKLWQLAAAAICTAGSASFVSAQTVYKCQTPGGGLQYQQVPCSPESRPTGRMAAPAAPSPADQYAAQMRLQRDLDRFRLQEEAAAAKAQQRELLDLERRRVEIEEKESAFQREQVTRNTRKGLETRSRAEWMERDKAQAQARANRPSRRPMTCVRIGQNFHCN